MPEPTASSAAALIEMAQRGACPDNSDLAAGAPREISLLLVDDDPVMLESLHQLVNLHGYRAEQALGGPAALALLGERRFDLVLLDLVMPEVSGHDLLDYAAAHARETKLIVVSGEGSFEGVQHALSCGAFSYVRKPYEPVELLAALDLAAAQRRLEIANQEMGARLRRSEELHRFMVDNSPDIVFMLDCGGRFTFANERIETLLGYRRENLIGRAYSELLHPDFLSVVEETLAEQFAEEPTKPGTFEVLLRRREHSMDLLGDRTRGVWVEVTIQALMSDPDDSAGQWVSGFLGTARDVSARKEAEEVISYQAFHDQLTGLPNRALLKDRLALAINQARRADRKLAVMFLDLDRFKAVNDTLGHSTGDRLLQAVGARLQGCLRSGDTLARFGGDEFMALLPDVRNLEDVAGIAVKILDQVGRPFHVDDNELFVGASIGIALYPDSGEDEETLIQNADIAMYEVKGRGKNDYSFFSDDMNHFLAARLTIERELRSGLSDGELVVYYQPQIELATGRISGVEALVRWRHPERGLLDPDAFLPIALETGLVPQLDRFVQAQAFLDVGAWRSQGYDLCVAVNVSALQLEQAAFVKGALAALKAAGLSPEHVKIEITENVLLRDMQVVLPKLSELRLAGAQIAIDDFGTGYSSLSYLRQFPVDLLKVDRSFVTDITGAHRDASIIDAIVAMAHGLKLDLIAEGVENADQLKYLIAQGCREAQGYIFSPPVDAETISRLLVEQPYRALVASLSD